MKRNNVSIKSFKSIALTLAMALVLCTVSLPNIVNAAEPSAEDYSNTNVVEVIDQKEFDALAARSGEILQDGRQISPGQTISGTFQLNNWFGTDFTVYLAVSDGSGYVHLSFVSAAYNVNCGDSVVVARETGWPRGTYSYSVTSHASSTVAYSLLIVEN